MRARTLRSSDDETFPIPACEASRHALSLVRARLRILWNRRRGIAGCGVCCQGHSGHDQLPSRRDRDLRGCRTGCVRYRGASPLRRRGVDRLGRIDHECRALHRAHPAGLLPGPGRLRGEDRPRHRQCRRAGYARGPLRSGVVFLCEHAPSIDGDDPLLLRLRRRLSGRVRRGERREPRHQRLRSQADVVRSHHRVQCDERG